MVGVDGVEPTNVHTESEWLPAFFAEVGEILNPLQANGDRTNRSRSLFVGNRLATLRDDESSG